MLVGLDFETYGSVDLRTHGLDRYISDPHFTPLIGRMYFTQGTHEVYRRYNFAENMHMAREELHSDLSTTTIVAHNAGFEAAVLKWLGIDHPLDRMIDSAVIARAAGASSHLAGAAPQLLGVNKMEEGVNLIKLFSVPGKLQEENGSMAFDPTIIHRNLFEWNLFGSYCDLDAKLGYRIADFFGAMITEREMEFQEITMKMNQRGWPVDLKVVKEMQRRYQENKEAALEQFRLDCDAATLNLNSLKQMKEWCADRGIKATSFDEKHVASLLTRIEAKLGTNSVPTDKRQGYEEVLSLLQTKQILGGSSLSKLETILNTVGHDGRLRDQYLHCGAGQTLRTTGKSVQMQNLKRFVDAPADMRSLFDDDVDWSNTEMAENLRQAFTASVPNGYLIVGDFSSVESRGLAWLAGEEWKLQSYRQKKDLYKVLASKIYHAAYDDITKTQRQTGKVGELSCGYGAGSGAVLEFAKNMKVDLSEGEAAKLVYDWRAANPKIVEFWNRLNEGLHIALQGNTFRLELPDGFTLRLIPIPAPSSLREQVQRADLQSLQVAVYDDNRVLFLNRVFHGVHMRGNNIGYFKPSDRKTGELWKNSYIDPKTKQRRFYELYGGKLAGILTQSFCRELFFRVLVKVESYTSIWDNLELIGQFHDEIILDWKPGTLNGRVLEDTLADLETLMSDPGRAKSFPLAADVKYDYRYTK